MPAITSWLMPLRHHAIAYRRLLLSLLLVFPLCASAATGSPAEVPKGFGAVDKRWCGFYPQLPFCPHSGTAVTARKTAPTGMGLVPINWCQFIPTLPICPDDGGNGPLQPVTGFGTNPGNLDAFKYVPADSGAAPRPLVVVLHGCTQKASSYDDETGWVKFADKFHFVLLFPQQKTANNSFRCFRWFDAAHNQRDKGEALSIRQMIDKVKTDTNIDAQRIYVTGLSAGGGMTAVMTATYPEMFAGGAPIAGIPYGCAHTDSEATSICGVSLGTLPGTPSTTPMQQLTSVEWGARVKSASPSNGTVSFPRVSIWQGTKDHVVNPQDETEMIKQWTNVLGVGQTPQVDEQFKTTRHLVFRDGAGKPMVEAFIVSNMDHGTPIDPGPANDQCGTSAHDQYIIPSGICSSFYIGRFWGLIP
ncbi:PHB depolymerase family esterase [Herbaspirillum sp. HC18]|nr:PHB depolymerase family esterase [Herbaspirillum sp. HC18]